MKNERTNDDVFLRSPIYFNNNKFLLNSFWIIFIIQTKEYLL